MSALLSVSLVANTAGLAFAAWIHAPWSMALHVLGLVLCLDALLDQCLYLGRRPW